MKRKTLTIAVAIAFGVACSGFAQTSPARQPFGIYAIVNINGCVNFPNSGTNTSTDDCITNSIAGLLNNPAVSGVAAFVTWSNLCPSVPSGSMTSTNGTTNWNILDDIFGAVQQWNTNNATNSNPKTIQLGLTPGFHTPQWILNRLIPCDAMFTANGVNTNLVTNICGCATFLSGEGQNAVVTNALLPLPWNPIYTNAWAEFIQAVAQRYGTNPLLVTVVMAGPTSDSTEIILPNENNNPTNNATNYMRWNPLFSLSFPSNYQNSDQAFIEAWERAIDMYGGTFSNLTLTLTTGSGLPNFLDTNGVPYPTYSVPAGFTPDCGQTNNLSKMMDCAAETTILAYFADPRHGGNNAKATQEDGLAAGEINLKPLGPGDLGSHGIKWLAASWASGSAMLPGAGNAVSRVLGGLQFDTSFVTDAQHEGCNMMGGCTTNDAPLPEQGLYNVLQVYFDGTKVGGAYGTNITSSNLPLNYLQIYAGDILYASTNTNGSLVIDGFGSTNVVTAQAELATASSQIFQVGEAVLYIESAGNNPQLLWPEAAAPFQLQVNSDLTKTNLWKTNSNTASPTLTNGFYQVPVISGTPVRFYRLALP